MRIVVQVKLLPSPEVASALECTLRTANDAANWLSGQAHERGETSRKALQGFAYRDLKVRGCRLSPRCMCCARSPTRTRRSRRTSVPGTSASRGRSAAARQMRSPSSSGRTRRSHTTTVVFLGKAKRAGVPLIYVDPAYTSQECAQCHHIEKKNRVDQARFICRNCGVVAHADRNASHNIAHRGETVWNAGRESRAPATP